MSIEVTEQERQAQAFVATHTWSPIENARWLAEQSVGRRFCDECADWHEADELHSQP